MFATRFPRRVPHSPSLAVPIQTRWISVRPAPRPTSSESPNQGTQENDPTANHARAASADRTASKAKYVRWWWEFLPGFRSQRPSMEEHRVELSVDATSPAALMKDLKEIRINGGKYSEAPATLFPVEHTIQMPSLAGETLVGTPRNLSDLLQRSGKPSLVLIKFKQVGEQHLKSFREPFLERFGSHRDRVQLVDVVVTERTPWAFLQRKQVEGLRRSTAQEHHDFTLLHYGAIPEIRLRLGLHNALVGWVFLTDRQGKIRWKAHGTATERELEIMPELIQALVKE